MKIPEITIKREVTIGQVIMSLFFLFGGIAAWAAIPDMVIETKDNLNSHIRDVEMVKKEFVRKDEYNAELSGIHTQLADIKLELQTIKGIALAYVTENGRPSPKSTSPSGTVDTKGGRGGTRNNGNTNSPN